MFSTTIRAIATILLGAVIFGVTFVLESPISLMLVFLLTLTALYGLGMLFASLFLMYGRGAWHTANLFQEPIFILSGFYFPIRFLGFYVALIASIIPMSLGIDAMNQLLGGSFAQRWSLLPVKVEIAALAGLTVVFFYLAVRALDFMENMGKKEGRLTLKFM
jgi:ABC-2 type transport system permease protein